MHNELRDETNQHQALVAASTVARREHRRGKHIRRGVVALGGTVLLVLGPGAAAFASSGPLGLGGLLDGAGVDVNAQAGLDLGAGGGSTPTLPPLPTAPTLPPTGNLTGTLANTSTVAGLLDGLGGDLNLDVVGGSTTPDGSSNAGGSGSAGASAGPGGSGSSSGGSPSLDADDPSSIQIGAPAGVTADANPTRVHGDASATVDAATKSRDDEAAPSPAVTDRARTVSAAEATRGSTPSGVAWELALVAFGAVAITGAANVYVIRRTRSL